MRLFSTRKLGGIDLYNYSRSKTQTLPSLPSHPLYRLSPHKRASTSMSSPVETTARERLRQHFGADISQHPSKWDDLYAQDFTPWDIGTPNPALIETLQRSDLIPPSVYGDSEGKVHRKRALVPGCGKGYDVLLLAAFGYDANGLESSPLALEKAKENEKNKAGDEVYIVRDEQKGKGKVNWLDGDFFKDGWLKDVDGDGTFDLIYDYTFLSAFPPSLRPAWSQRLNKLLAQDGRLICLEFPTYKPTDSGGPPWALPPKVYMGHLPRPGVELFYDEKGDLDEKKLGEPTVDGLRRIAHFQPQKTHAIGYDADGNITDRLSVWAHKTTS